METLCINKMIGLPIFPVLPAPSPVFGHCPIHFHKRVLRKSVEQAMKKMVQDKRKKATYLQKIQVIAIAIAARLSQEDLRARRSKKLPDCAVLGAMGEQQYAVEDYMGESGMEKNIPPVQEISNLVNAAYLSRGEEEDVAYLSMRAMEEQSHGLMACLLKKAMEEQNSVEEHRTRVEGDIAPRDALYPTVRVLSSSKKQPTHHRMSTMHARTNLGDRKTRASRGNRSSDKDVVLKKDEMEKQEMIKYEIYLQMLHICRPFPSRCIGSLNAPIFSPAQRIIVVCKPVL